MPRNGSGVYSLPAGYAATDGVTAIASQHNGPLEDIQADLNAARPVTAGGTGATTPSGARTGLGLAIGSDVQAYSARLSDIAAITPTDGRVLVGDGSTWVAESGSTARTSLGAQAADQALTDLSGISFSAGDLIYHNGSALVRRAKGTAGQVLVMNSGATAPEWGEYWTSFSEVSTSSGTGPIVLLSSLPSGISEIELDWREVSASTSDNFLLQLRTSSGYVTSGYDGQSGGAGTTVTINDTTGFPVRNGGGSNSHSGTLHLKKIDGTDTWVISRNVRNSVVGGSVALASRITGVRLTFDGGTPNFDGGGISGRYR